MAWKRGWFPARGLCYTFSAMHRFYLPPEACQGPVMTLPEPEAHHALHALRVHERERVVVLNGAGDELLCEVAEAGRGGVRLKLVHKTAIPPLPYQVTLLQAMPKARAMDLIVQKATELGAHRIVPLLAERTVATPEAMAVPRKVERWHSTIVEAAKQSGTAWLPTIDAPTTPQAFLARNEKFELSLIASLQPEARHPREYFRAFLAEKRRAPRTVAMWVGPEGDFTPAEINAVRATGALAITLGPVILRSETAAIYCLSILSYELQAPGEAGREG